MPSKRHGVQRQVDGVELDVGDGVDENGAALGGGGRAAGHLGWPTSNSGHSGRPGRASGSVGPQGRCLLESVAAWANSSSAAAAFCSGSARHKTCSARWKFHPYNSKALPSAPRLALCNDWRPLRRAMACRLLVSAGGCMAIYELDGVAPKKWQRRPGLPTAHR